MPNENQRRRDGDRALVRNGADPKQVRDSERVERRREQRRLAAFTAVLKTQEGRFVFWDLISRAGVYRSVSHQHGGLQSQNIGRQDFGHELMALVLESGDDLYLAMEREGRALESRDNTDLDARSTPSTTEGENRD